jgi:hypothetical protein
MQLGSRVTLDAVLSSHKYMTQLPHTRRAKVSNQQTSSQSVTGRSFIDPRQQRHRRSDGRPSSPPCSPPSRTLHGRVLSIEVFLRHKEAMKTHRDAMRHCDGCKWCRRHRHGVKDLHKRQD